MLKIKTPKRNKSESEAGKCNALVFYFCSREKCPMKIESFPAVASQREDTREKYRLRKIPTHNRERNFQFNSRYRTYMKPNRCGYGEKPNKNTVERERRRKKSENLVHLLSRGANCDVHFRCSVGRERFLVRRESPPAFFPGRVRQSERVSNGIAHGEVRRWEMARKPTAGSSE